MTSVMQRGLIFVGLDVHKDSISAGVLRPRAEVPEVERIFNDEELIRRFFGRFRQSKALRVCYEAGPTGFGLARPCGTCAGLGRTGWMTASGPGNSWVRCCCGTGASTRRGSVDVSARAVAGCTAFRRSRVVGHARALPCGSGRSGRGAGCGRG
jgi:hypothetical protein